MIADMETSIDKLEDKIKELPLKQNEEERDIWKIGEVRIRKINGSE